MCNSNKKWISSKNIIPIFSIWLISTKVMHHNFIMVRWYMFTFLCINNSVILKIWDLKTKIKKWITWMCITHHCYKLADHWIKNNIPQKELYKINTKFKFNIVLPWIQQNNMWQTYERLIQVRNINTH